MKIAGTLTYKTELDTNGIKKSGNTVKSIIKGLGITKMISTAMNTINNSIDGAISRFDTLNNFSKVMSNLGIASEEADKSIKKMSDKLAGLPTTLDQGAMAVQRFTSANGDVKKSTDIFLALNNALLAGGASADIQSTALEQISQAYAKGKPDMMEWRAMMTAMPAQLKQVATAMGYVSSSDLGESIRADGGEEEFQRFIETILQLNEEGVDGFQNFEEQAKNSTGGIGTAITNMKTQIVKGVTEMITAINDGLAQANLPSISEIIASIGKKAKEVLDKIASKLPSIIKFMVNLYEAIKPMLPIIESVGAGILAVVLAYTAYQKIVTIVTAVQSALNLVMAMNPIGLLVLAIVGLITIFVMLWNKCEWFRNFWIAMWEAIKEGFINAWNMIKAVFTTIIDFIQNNWKQLLLFIVNPFAGAFALLYNNCEAFRNFVNKFVNGIIDFFKTLPAKMKEIGLNIAKGIGKGITSGVQWVKDRIKEFVGNVMTFFKKLFKISSPSKLMADSIGKYLPMGVAVGIEANTDSVTKAMDDMYKEMNNTIRMENSKLNFDVISGDVYNKSFFQTPVAINVQADVEMDSQKVGRLVTPAVTKTIKTGGGI